MTRLLLLSAALSGVLSGLVRCYAQQHAVLDFPNERSSHTTPTPRGGGAGLLGAVTLTLIAGAGTGLVDWRIVTALAGVALAAVVGWMDDHRPLGVYVRLGAHLVGAVALLPLALLPVPMPSWLGLAAALWWVVWAVSSINVINFMDGIDGFIGLQAIVYGGHLAVNGSAGGLVVVLGVALAGAAAGFLPWNWAPARLFLGDIGSGSLGLLFVLGGLMLMREGRVGLLSAFLPLYPVFLDAAFTLVRRAWRGERLTQAHRSHLYQRLANGGWGHARVSILYAAAAAAGLGVAQVASGTPAGIATAAYLLLVPVVAVPLDRAYRLCCAPSSVVDPRRV